MRVYRYLPDGTKADTGIELTMLMPCPEPIKPLKPEERIVILDWLKIRFKSEEKKSDE